MQFDTFAEFLAMGGHGLYVWMAYGATVALLLLNYASARRGYLNTLRNLEWQASVQQNQGDEQTTQNRRAGDH